MASAQITNIFPAPFEWCEIPAGFVMLDDASDIAGTAGGTYEVSSFQIAKFPITNAQYQVFVDETDGFQNAHWWDYSTDAQNWHAANLQPEDTAFSGDDLPRTNVSWFDAVALCRWLSTCLTDEVIVTLLTEQQWQHAAQSDDSRLYPWGNQEPNTSLCNFDRNVGQPTPVTHYPQGASPYGVMDMSGNIWEWCLTAWGCDENRLDVDTPRAIRGGSWSHDATNASTVYRPRLKPDCRFEHLGFRIGLNVPF